MPVSEDIDRDVILHPFTCPTTELTFDIDSLDKVTVTNVSHYVPREGDENPDSIRLDLDTKYATVKEIHLNGEEVSADRVSVLGKKIEISGIPEGEFDLTFVTELNPATNESGQGLYVSDPENKVLSTQGESSGFRQMTAGIDDPHSRTIYTTTIIAPKKDFPVLLAHGDDHSTDGVSQDPTKHASAWHDPQPKPSYLFAMVAGDLVGLSDTYYSEPRADVIKLEAYVPHAESHKARFGLDHLKGALGYYERRFGMVYSGKKYIEVSVPKFNAGAMENKGLNIFANSCFLVDPVTAPDEKFNWVLHVVAHELAHDKFGDDVGISHWKYLFLKEGAATMLEGLYAHEMGLEEEVLQRISDVSALRIRQFAEEYSSMGHTLLVQGMDSIDNYYTLTTYYKGKELLQTLMELIGRERWIEGMRLYLTENDGKAVGLREFIKSMEEVSGHDLTQFATWYTQPGTPSVSAETSYDAATGKFTINLKQVCPLTEAEKKLAAADEGFVKSPFQIPVKISILNPVTGEPLELSIGGESKGTETVLVFDKQEQSFTIDLPEGLELDGAKPIPSMFRNFSAPVRFEHPLTQDEKLFLMRCDTDEFNRWDLAYNMMVNQLVNMYDSHKDGGDVTFEPDVIDAHRRIISDASMNAGFKAEVLSFPGMMLLKTEIISRFGEVDLDVLGCVMDTARAQYSDALAADYHSLYTSLDGFDNLDRDAENKGARALRCTALGHLSHCSRYSPMSAELGKLISAQASSVNMTLTQSALRCATVVASHDKSSAAQELQQGLLRDFHAKYKKDGDLLSDWMRIFINYTGDDAVERVREFIFDSGMVDLRQQAHVYGAVRAFTRNLPVFHRRDGAGYVLAADCALAIDAFNPKMSTEAARMLSEWQGLDDRRVGMLVSQCVRMFAESDSISTDLAELVTKTLVSAPKEHVIPQLKDAIARTKANPALVEVLCKVDPAEAISCVTSLIAELDYSDAKAIEVGILGYAENKEAEQDPGDVKPTFSAAFVEAMCSSVLQRNSVSAAASAGASLSLVASDTEPAVKSAGVVVHAASPGPIIVAMSGGRQAAFQAVAHDPSEEEAAEPKAAGGGGGVKAKPDI